jgi:hypothetical protein
MKKLLLLVLCFIAFKITTFSQEVANPSIGSATSGATIVQGKLYVKKLFYLGRYASIDVVPTPTQGGAIVFITDSVSTTAFLWTGTEWIKWLKHEDIVGNFVDSIYVRNDSAFYRQNTEEVFYAYLKQTLYVVTPLHALNDSTWYIAQASATDSGYLIMEDWIRFNHKVDSIYVENDGGSVDSFFYDNGESTRVPFYVNDVQADAWIVAPSVNYTGIPYTYDITAGVMRMGGRRINILPTRVVLDSSESDPRIDVFYSDSSGHSSVSKGTSDPNPVKPQVDETWQREITFLQIPGGVGQTPELDTSFIYKNNAEGWNVSLPSGLTVDSANTIPGTVYEGTKSVNVSGTVNSSNYRFSRVAPFDLSPYTSITLYIKLKAPLTGNNNIAIRWLNGTSAVSTLINLTLARNNISSYQPVNVNLTQFGLTTNIVTALQVYSNGTTVSPYPGYYLDYAYLQRGIPVLPAIIPVTSISSYNTAQDTIKYVTADGINHIFPYKASAPIPTLDQVLASGSSISVDRSITTSTHQLNISGSSGAFGASYTNGSNVGSLTSNASIVQMAQTFSGTTSSLIAVTSGLGRLTTTDGTNTSTLGVKPDSITFNSSHGLYKYYSVSAGTGTDSVVTIDANGVIHKRNASLFTPVTPTWQSVMNAGNSTTTKAIIYGHGITGFDTTKGLLLANYTPATNSVQSQFSPDLRFSGSGWNFFGSSSVLTHASIYFEPSSAFVSYLHFRFKNSIDNWVDGMYLTSGGTSSAANLHVNGSISASTSFDGDNFDTHGIGGQVGLTIGGITAPNTNSNFFTGGINSNTAQPNYDNFSKWLYPGTVTEAASGSHNMIAGTVLSPVTLLNGGATTRHYATLYIPRYVDFGATVDSIYAMWIDSGDVRIGGIRAGLSTDSILTVNSKGVIFKRSPSAVVTAGGTPTWQQTLLTPGGDHLTRSNDITSDSTFNLFNVSSSEQLNLGWRRHTTLGDRSQLALSQNTADLFVVDSTTNYGAGLTVSATPGASSAYINASDGISNFSRVSVSPLSLELRSNTSDGKITMPWLFLGQISSPTNYDLLMIDNTGATRRVAPITVGNFLSGAVSTPTLQAVTTAGNATTNNIVINGSALKVTDATPEEMVSLDYTDFGGGSHYGSIHLGVNSNPYQIKLLPTAPTAPRSIFFPDASGTVALTSDIAAAAQDLQSVTDVGNITSNPVASTNQNGFLVQTLAAQVLASANRSFSQPDYQGELFVGDTLANSTYYRVYEIKHLSDTLTLPFTGSSHDTLARLSDIRSGISGSGAITGTTDNLLKVTGANLNTNKTFSVLTYSSTPTWDLTTGYNKTITLTGDPVISFSNAQSGDAISLIVAQDGTGGHLLTIGSNAPTINPTASSSTVVGCIYNGTVWSCASGYSTNSGTNTGDVTLSGAGQTYLTIAGQVITANAVNLSGTHVTGTLAAARFGALTGMLQILQGVIRRQLQIQRSRMRRSVPVQPSHFQN